MSHTMPRNEPPSGNIQGWNERDHGMLQDLRQDLLQGLSQDLSHDLLHDLLPGMLQGMPRRHAAAFLGGKRPDNPQSASRVV